MKRLFATDPWLAGFTTVMVIYSCLMLVSALALGIHVSAQGEVGYWQKLNWALYPIFWPVLACLIHFSWKLYMAAWLSLGKNGVLYRSGCLVEDSSVLDPY